MGLSIRCEKGKSIPVLTCDTCGKPIEELGLAMVAWDWPSRDSTVPVKVFHKGSCDPGNRSSEELRNYLPWLLWNHKWAKKRTTAKGATLTLDVPEPLDT